MANNPERCLTQKTWSILKTSNVRPQNDTFDVRNWPNPGQAPNLAADIVDSKLDDATTTYLRGASANWTSWDQTTVASGNSRSSTTKLEFDPRLTARRSKMPSWSAWPHKQKRRTVEKMENGGTNISIYINMFMSKKTSKHTIIIYHQLVDETIMILAW